MHTFQSQQKDLPNSKRIQKVQEELQTLALQIEMKRKSDLTPEMTRSHAHNHIIARKSTKFQMNLKRSQ